MKIERALNKLSFEANDAAHTEVVGAAFAAQASAPLSLWLAGDLGSGKTTFSRGFIRALGYRGHVKSPTYTLLETYEAGAFNVLHFDLYRLGGAREFEALGADYFDECSICLIEWPENVAGNASRLPAPDVALRFLFADAGRVIQAEARSDAGAALLENLSPQKRKISEI